MLVASLYCPKVIVIRDFLLAMSLAYSCVLILEFLSYSNNNCFCRFGLKMMVFSTIVDVVERAPCVFTVALGSTVSMITCYVCDHRDVSGYTSKKAVSSSSVPVQRIPSICLKFLSAQKTGKASIIFLN